MEGGFRELIIQVISSWQVIAVTVSIAFYVFLVNYASRSHYRKRSPLPAKPKKIKAPKEGKVDDSDLGLEE